LLTALVRSAALGSVLFLSIACGGKAGDPGAPPGSDVIMPGGDRPPPTLPTNTPPPSVPAVPTPATPPGGEPSTPTAARQTCTDRRLSEYCTISPACSYEHVEEDPYIVRYYDGLDASCLPPPAADAGSDAGAAPSCRPALADYSCTCVDSSTGASYTLVVPGGGDRTLSLYYANGAEAPDALVGVVVSSDICTDCGCNTYYGARIDCACPYGLGDGN
jgi:hypothetical protein